MPKTNAKSSDKTKQIALQNAIFGVEERKLMVSPEFLNNAAIGYISKRIGMVNKYTALLSATKSPKSYFAYSDIIDQCLDDLVLVEPFYKFRRPKPSEFREMLLSKREHSIGVMLNRIWKHLLNRAIVVDGVPQNIEPFELVLREMSPFTDRLTTVNLTALEMYKNSIRKKAAPDVPEKEEAAGEIADNPESEGFEEEIFPILPELPE